MARPVPPSWLPRLLFRLTVGLSGVLVLLVLLAPLFHRPEARAEGWGRLVALFALDPTLRRTALASALGLTVTACVFFNPPVNPWRDRSKRTKVPPPPNVVGA